MLSVILFFDGLGSGTPTYPWEEQYFLVLWKCSLFYTGSKLPIFRKPFTREVSEGLLSFTPPFLDVVGPTGVSFIVSFMFHQFRFPGTLLYLIMPFLIWDRPIIFTHNPNPGGWCIIFTQTLNPGVSCTWQTGCLPCWALRGLNHHPVRFPFQFPFFLHGVLFSSSLPSSFLLKWFFLAEVDPPLEISFLFFMFFLFLLFCLYLFSWTE